MRYFTRIYRGDVRIEALPNRLWFCRILSAAGASVDLFVGPCRPTADEARIDARIWLEREGLCHPVTHDLLSQKPRMT